MVLELFGLEKDILIYERLLLNILQYASGIATLTSHVVKKANAKTQILDTRKTHPGLRSLAKQAVKDGGGKNHRMNLSDQYLIKENHIEVAGSLEAALEAVKKHQKKIKGSKPKIEIEVKNLDELKRALVYKPNIIMLDNMNVKQIKKAIEVRNALKSSSQLEISGGVTLKTISKYKNLQVERISIGSLTHSFEALDLSLYVKKKN